MLVSTYLLAIGGAGGASTVLCVIEYARQTLSVGEAYEHLTVIGSMPLFIALSIFFDISSFSEIYPLYKVIQMTMIDAKIVPAVIDALNIVLFTLFICFSLIHVKNMTTDLRSFVNIPPSGIDVICMVK